MKKYVVVRSAKENAEVAILSNDTIQHADMVAGRIGIEPVSAGFFKLEVDDATGKFMARAYGDSSSLHLESRPEQDSKLINELLNGW
jgi:hypothetical protein